MGVGCFGTTPKQSNTPQLKTNKPTIHEIVISDSKKENQNRNKGVGCFGTTSKQSNPTQLKTNKPTIHEIVIQDSKKENQNRNKQLQIQIDQLESSMKSQRQTLSSNLSKKQRNKIQASIKFKESSVIARKNIILKNNNFTLIAQERRTKAP